MSKQPEFRVVIRARAVRTMSAEELADMADQVNATIDAANKQINDAWYAEAEAASKREHELAEYFKGVASCEEVVAGREAVLRGEREALPEDLAAWKADVARREAALRDREIELGRPSTVAALQEWERHLGEFARQLEVREGALKHDATVLEGRVLRLGTEEKTNAARRHLLGGNDGSKG